MKKINKYKQMLLASILCSSILMPSTAFSQSAMNYSAAETNPCVNGDCSYNPAYEKQGCSKLAWAQVNGAFNAEMNNVNVKTNKYNEKMIKGIMDPNKMDLGDCLGDIAQQFAKVHEAFELITGMANLFDNGSLMDAAKSQIMNLPLNKIKEQALHTITKHACKSTSKLIKGQMNNFRISEGIDALTDMVNNPFGAAQAATGIPIGKYINGNITDTLNKEFDDLLTKKIGGK